MLKQFLKTSSIISSSILVLGPILMLNSFAMIGDDEQDKNRKLSTSIKKLEEEHQRLTSYIQIEVQEKLIEGGTIDRDGKFTPAFMQQMLAAKEEEDKERKIREMEEDKKNKERIRALWLQEQKEKNK